MKIAKVIGTLTLARFHPSMKGARLRCVETLDQMDQLQQADYGGDTIIAWDLCGAGIGDWVAMAEGPESAQPFRPDIKPLDASIVAILDDVDVAPPSAP